MFFFYPLDFQIKKKLIKYHGSDNSLLIAENAMELDNNKSQIAVPNSYLLALIFSSSFSWLLNPFFKYSKAFLLFFQNES